MVDSRETTGRFYLSAFETKGDILSSYLLIDISNINL